MTTPQQAAGTLVSEILQQQPGLTTPQAQNIAAYTASRLVENSRGIPILFDYWVDVERTLRTSYVSTEPTASRSSCPVCGEPDPSAAITFLVKRGVIDTRSTDRVILQEGKAFSLVDLLEEYSMLSIAKVAMEAFKK